MSLDVFYLFHPVEKSAVLVHCSLLRLCASGCKFSAKTFIAPNVRVMARDELYYLCEIEWEKAVSRNASEYSEEWARDDQGWLGKVYPLAEDRAHFDLTLATEKEIAVHPVMTEKT